MFQIDGKQLCWLCTKSYKRALAKARQVHTDRHHSSKKRPAAEESSNSAGQKVSKTSHSSSHGKKHSRPHHDNSNKPTIEIPEKVQKAAPVIDPHSSDHVIAMTQLKETIASLQKRLAQKDRDILQKEKEVSQISYGLNIRLLIFLNSDYRAQRKTFYIGK